MTRNNMLASLLAFATGYVVAYVTHRESSENMTRATLELVRQQRDLMVADFQGQLRALDREVTTLRTALGKGKQSNAVSTN